MLLMIAMIENIRVDIAKKHGSFNHNMRVVPKMKIFDYI